MASSLCHAEVNLDLRFLPLCNEADFVCGINNSSSNTISFPLFENGNQYNCFDFIAEGGKERMRFAEEIRLGSTSFMPTFKVEGYKTHFFVVAILQYLRQEDYTIPVNRPGRILWNLLSIGNKSSSHTSHGIPIVFLGDLNDHAFPIRRDNILYAILTRENSKMVEVKLPKKSSLEETNSGFLFTTDTTANFVPWTCLKAVRPLIIDGFARIRFHDIFSEIPLENRNALFKAGKIDLRWKCGDIVSEPLPLWVGSLDGVTNCPYATGCF